MSRQTLYIKVEEWHELQGVFAGCHFALYGKQRARSSFGKVPTKEDVRLMSQCSSFFQNIESVSERKKEGIIHKGKIYENYLKKIFFFV